MTQEKQRTLSEDGQDIPEKNPRSVDDRLLVITRMAGEISDKLGELMERVDEIHEKISENHSSSHYDSDYEDLIDSEE